MSIKLPPLPEIDYRHTMTQQTTAQILATELENEAALEANEEIQDTLNKAAAELRRLDAIESEWARLSQDDGKAKREIERLKTAQQPVGTYEEIAQAMCEMQRGTLAQQQVYEVVKNNPLYTSPQPAKQPLTDEEIVKIQRSHPSFMISSCRAFARAIEAAHNITKGTP